MSLNEHVHTPEQMDQAIPTYYDHWHALFEKVLARDLQNASVQSYLIDVSKRVVDLVVDPQAVLANYRHAEARLKDDTVATLTICDVFIGDACLYLTNLVSLSRGLGLGRLTESHGIQYVPTDEDIPSWEIYDGPIVPNSKWELVLFDCEGRRSIGQVMHKDGVATTGLLHVSGSGEEYFAKPIRESLSADERDLLERQGQYDFTFQRMKNMLDMMAVLAGQDSEQSDTVKPAILPID